MTKKTKVVIEVESIINSGMKIAEKKKALAAVKVAGRPGCSDAQNIIATWRGRLCAIKRDLLSHLNIEYKLSDDKLMRRIHSLTSLSLPDVVAIGNYIPKILNECLYYGFDDFVKRFSWAYTACSNEYVEPRINRYYNKPYGSLAFGIAQIYDWSDRWQVADKDEYTFRRELGKLLSKVCAPFLQEYRNEILPVLNERKATIAKRDKENDDWWINFGFRKYRSVTTCTLNYIESPLSAGKNDKVVMFPYAFAAKEDVSEDWEYYSKAWHRAHGPKRTVTGREVRVYKWGNGHIDTIEMSKWKPGFMVEIVAQVLGLQQPKVEKQLRKFQPSPWVDVKRSVKRDGVQFYNLTMGKYTVGVVAYDEERDIHFHGDTREAAVSGLRKKIEKIDADKNRKAMEAACVMTADYAHNRWGFCWPGMTEFANAIGFDIDGSYTVSELRKAVSELKDRRIIVKYRRELEVARIINF